MEFKDLIDKRLVKLMADLEEAETKEEKLDIEDEIDAWIRRRDDIVNQEENEVKIAKFSEEAKAVKLYALAEMTKSMNPAGLLGGSFSDIMRRATAIDILRFEKDGVLPSKMTMPFLVPKK